MCRLFGLSAAPHRVRATFWLLDASDSLAAQSRREPDGVGLGTFEPDGEPMVHKRAVAAYEDAEFAREAHELSSGTFIGHIRYASTGDVSPRNTHPFQQDGRLLAHNGVVLGLDRLERRIESESSAGMAELVAGQTDSERVFALITALIRRGLSVDAAITEAVGWIADHLPVYAVNLVLTTSSDLWALRYPATHPLYMLARAPGGPAGDRHLEHASAAGTLRVRSGDLAAAPSVIVATERMDEDPNWRPLAPGELLHVAADQRISGRVVLDRPPAHPLTLADLEPQAAASQRAGDRRGVRG